MKEIQLTQGKVALVDDGDFELLNKYKWSAHKGRGAWYATRGVGPIKMHRQITHAPIGAVVDHINGNGLDNRRINLRVCSHSENMRNSALRSDNTTGYKGVRKRTDRKWYSAEIRVNGLSVNLGRFETAEGAARAYDEAAKKYFGDFARLNFQEAAASK